MTDEEKMATIAKHFEAILNTLGLNNLKKTPDRMAKLYVQEIFSGLKRTELPTLTLLENKQKEKQMVCVQTSLTSFCEHHLLPFIGTAYIAYLPQEKLIGFAHISQLVRHFAKRPQLQERLTEQIAHSLAIILETEDVAVMIKADHFCTIAREIDSQSHTTTAILKGKFEQDNTLHRQFLEATSHLKKGNN